MADDARFWKHVSVVDDADSCWLWTARVDKDGYGKVTRDGISMRAHRVSWEIANGRIPAGAIVRQSCDVPGCVRPGHLLLGTFADNSGDMVRRGRSLTGDRNPVRVDPSLLNRGDLHWTRRLPGAAKALGRKIAGENHGSAKLTWALVNEMRERFAKGGISMRTLAEEYGVGQAAVSRILARKRWT